MKNNLLKKLIVSLVAVSVIPSLLTGCGVNKAAAAKQQVITANLGAEPKSIDPAVNFEARGSTIIYNIFEGLTRIGLDNKTEPGLAEKWDIEDNGLKYVFHLRDGLKWSDNTALTAQDFKYGILRVLDPKTASPYAYYGYSIKNGEAYNKGKAKAEDVGVKAIDDKTLEIDLDYAVPYFLDILSWHLMLPVKQSVVESNSTGWAADVSTLVTDGPFKVTEWKHGDYIQLEKNPNYWDAKNVKLEKLKLTMMTNENTALTAYKTGQINVNNLIPSAQLPTLLASKEAESKLQVGTKYILLNQTKKPFDNPNVRKALSLAIDRTALVETVLKGGQKAAEGYIPTGTPDTAGDKDFRTNGGSFLNTKADVQKAKELLKEAGYPDGNGFPQVEYIYSAGGQIDQAYAEALQSMWKENLGINVTIKGIESKVYLSTLKQGNYQMGNLGWLSDFFDPGSLLEVWLSDSPNNFAKYSNQQYDSLVKKGERENDPQKRSEYLHEAEKILLNDLPMIPSYYLATTYMINSNVKGVNMSPLGWMFFRGASVE
ncbi:MAG: peptide ABC transporter substrate-binding protein [Clostridiaceae bacterium]